MQSSAPGSDVELAPMSHANNLAQVQDLVTDLQQLINKEYEDLRQKWSEFEAKSGELNRIRDRLRSIGKDNDRLQLNVGGERFEIREECIRGNEYFRALFSRTFIAPDSDGFFFIDRDPEMMPFILNYLRRSSSAVELKARLNVLSDAELTMLEVDAEFYMVHDLLREVTAHMDLRRSSRGILTESISLRSATERCNGIVFELNITKKNVKIHGLRIATSDPSRHVVAELYYRAGPMQRPPSQMRQVATAAFTLPTGMLGDLPCSSLPLAEGIHTFGIYSPTGQVPLVAAPRRSSERQFAWGTIERSYHVTGAKGLLHVSGEDVMDFSGEIFVSY